MEQEIIKCEQCGGIVSSTFGGLCRQCQIENKKHNEIISALKAQHQPTNASAEICSNRICDYCQFNIPCDYHIKYSDTVKCEAFRGRKLRTC